MKECGHIFLLRCNNLSFIPCEHKTLLVELKLFCYQGNSSVCFRVWASMGVLCWCTEWHRNAVGTRLTARAIAERIMYTKQQDILLECCPTLSDGNSRTAHDFWWGVHSTSGEIFAKFTGVNPSIGLHSLLYRYKGHHDFTHMNPAFAWISLISRVICPGAIGSDPTFAALRTAYSMQHSV